jgi:hypothetical protein
MEATVGQIRGKTLDLKNPEMIGNRIMEAIAGLPGDFRRAEPSASLASTARNDRLKPRGISDRFSGFAFLKAFHERGIRFGLAIAASTIVIVFFIQESLVLSKISMLEERMAALAKNPAMMMPMRSGISLPMDGIRRLPEAAVRSAEIGEEWITVRRTDIETLLRSVQDSRRFNALLLKIIQKQYPGIRGLDPELSLDSEKVIRVLRANPALIRQFLQSSSTGGRT